MQKNESSFLFNLELLFMICLFRLTIKMLIEDTMSVWMGIKDIVKSCYDILESIYFWSSMGIKFDMVWKFQNKINQNNGASDLKVSICLLQQLFNYINCFIVKDTSNYRIFKQSFNLMNCLIIEGLATNAPEN